MHAAANSGWWLTAPCDSMAISGWMVGTASDTLAMSVERVGAGRSGVVEGEAAPRASALAGRRPAGPGRPHVGVVGGERLEGRPSAPGGQGPGLEAGLDPGLELAETLEGAGSGHEPAGTGRG